MERDILTHLLIGLVFVFFALATSWFCFMLSLCHEGSGIFSSSFEPQVKRKNAGNSSQPPKYFSLKACRWKPI